MLWTKSETVNQSEVLIELFYAVRALKILAWHFFEKIILQIEVSREPLWKTIKASLALSAADERSTFFMQKTKEKDIFYTPFYAEAAGPKFFAYHVLGDFLLRFDWFNESSKACRLNGIKLRTSTCIFGQWLWLSVTRLADLLDFGQVFKAFGNN